MDGNIQPSAVNLQCTMNNEYFAVCAKVQRFVSVRILSVCTNLRKPFVNCKLLIVHCLQFAYSNSFLYLCTRFLGGVAEACRECIEVISYPTHTYNILRILFREVENLVYMNCKIHPVLHKYYLRLHDTMGAEIVHRRTRKSCMSIEIIFYCDGLQVVTGRINTLREAEACGFWVICRPQTQRKHMIYNNRRVYQLFLSPVHPKKIRESEHIITPLNSSIASSRTRSSANG